MGYLLTVAMEQTYRQSSTYLIIRLLIDFLLMSVFIGFFTFFKHILSYFSARIILTNYSIILKRGLITVKTTEIPYMKVNTISIKQGLIGQILNYGDLVFLSGNDVVGIPFKGVSSPKEIKGVIYNYIEKKSPSLA
jgi:uncharacterized membrane protein YdbT with pleckstrin-like domain